MPLLFKKKLDAESSAALYENKYESESFYSTAMTWKGSVTPLIMSRAVLSGVYFVVVSTLLHFYPNLHIPVTPFEYSGVILGLLLVMRVNAGHDRWWEARKIWGSIVNQSRNLATIVLCYSRGDQEQKKELLEWICIWPYAMKESLRGSRNLPYQANDPIALAIYREVVTKSHLPNYIGCAIATRLERIGLDGFAFHRAESERAKMIDNIGKSERILKTPMPFVLAIKSRRFISLFLALLPFGLHSRLGELTPLVGLLVSYALLSLDQIGVELQKPFSKASISHLPLDKICDTIATNIRSLTKEVKSADDSISYDFVELSQFQQLNSQVSKGVNLKRRE